MLHAECWNNQVVRASTIPQQVVVVMRRIGSRLFNHYADCCNNQPEDWHYCSSDGGAGVKKTRHALVLPGAGATVVAHAETNLQVC